MVEFVNNDVTPHPSCRHLLPQAEKGMKTLLIFLFLFIIPSSLHSENSNPVRWNPLIPGLQEAHYVTQDSKGSSIRFQLYKIDPKRFRFQLYQAKDFNTDHLTAKDLTARTKALIAVN